MTYVRVLPTEVRYQKTEPLTYSVTSPCKIGSVVIVPYGKKSVLGVVVELTKSKPKFATKDVLEILDIPCLPKTSLELLDWMHQYYPGGGSVTQLFISNGIAGTHRTTKPAAIRQLVKLPKPTVEQMQAIKIIRNTNGSVLVHGETGSGKTRLYVEALFDCINNGKSAMLLVPEISLVPQMSEYLESVFGDKIVVMHSGLTKATKAKNWLRILKSDTPVIVLGTRSALFSPVNKLGLVVVDEMHEPAYKQDSSPRYYAIRVAGKLARIHSAKIIYGSATPPISEYFIARQTGTPIIEMKLTALPSNEVKKTVIDMRDSKNLSSFHYFSSNLVDAIRKRIDGNQQTLLFLNRRGTARQILCVNCGWQALCPNCDTPLIYHGDKHIVLCHTCGHKASPPYNCPECKSDEITYKSLGTKALVESLHSMFPEAIVKRFDTDNLASEKLDKHFESIKSGKVDILVGTQMLGKGLDLPKLSLVGIINADAGLSMPDFSAAERSYQLLHQASGRVGRGHLSGEVIVQTYNPGSPIIKSAINKDWQSLYQEEIKEREKFLFPPFCYLLKINVSRKSSSTAETYAKKVFSDLSKIKLPVQINAPAPSFYERSYGKYNWQIVIKAKKRPLLIKLINELPSGDWTYDLDPINLL